MEKIYTLGEILRLGLLKSYKGTPYTSKATILRTMAKIPHKRVQTPWGIGYAVLAKDIAAHNKRIATRSVVE